MTGIQLYHALPNILKRVVLKVIKTIQKEWKSEILRTIWEGAYGVKVGVGSYGCFVPGSFSSGDEIGNYCSIAGNVWHLNANHPMHCASMSPLFYQKAFGGNADAKDVERTALTVGHDVWIGRDVKILSNVTKIGNGAVIGAGSIVTRDIPANTVAVGNPCRVLREISERDKEYRQANGIWVFLFIIRSLTKGQGTLCLINNWIHSQCL